MSSNPRLCRDCPAAGREPGERDGEVGTRLFCRLHAPAGNAQGFFPIVSDYDWCVEGQPVGGVEFRIDPSKLVGAGPFARALLGQGIPATKLELERDPTPPEVKVEEGVFAIRLSDLPYVESAMSVGIAVLRSQRRAPETIGICERVIREMDEIEGGGRT
jgi:hypothetical protein